jgi:hypothetical protein
MSGSSSNTSTIVVTGIGTKGGGLFEKPLPPPGGVSGPVSNQSQLVLDASIFSDLSPETTRKLKIIQLQFAQQVSEAAAAAYKSVLDQIQAVVDKEPDQANGG